MSKGRQVGQTKKLCKIQDDVITPYEIWVEEDQYVLVDTSKSKTIGYFSTLDTVVKKVSRLRLVKSGESYTLTGFIESFNNIKNELLKSFKQVD